jgi:hypothetical protein
VVRYTDLTGHRHFVYPQQELVTDLVAKFVAAGGDARFEVTDVRLHDITTGHPAVTYRTADSGADHRIDCDFVAGCDGAHGVTQGYLPPESTIKAHHDYGIGWLALLAEAPPSADGVLFGIHPRGFAAHMARTPAITRFYLQTTAGETEADWPDERVWPEVQARLAVPDGPIQGGPLVEKRVLDMHNYVIEPMSYGRLHLAGEAAHLVAPITARTPGTARQPVPGPGRRRPHAAPAPIAGRRRRVRRDLHWQARRLLSRAPAAHRGPKARVRDRLSQLRCERLTAERTARMEAPTVSASTPTPQRVRPSISHST